MIPILLFAVLFPFVFTKEPTFFKNIKAITKDGTNAEAYWSFDGLNFTFQAVRGDLGKTHPCDQIYTMSAHGSDIKLQSPGTGRTTCSYFYPDGNHLIYSKTTKQTECPPSPDMRFGYLWPVYKDMDIFIKHIPTGASKKLFSSSGYDAEATVSPDGKKIIFTSAMDGDLELYTMNLDGSDIRRITYTPGYDGGAYFSPNNKMITWRANRPQGNALLEYFKLLDFGLVAPTNMQIFIQDISLRAPAIQLTNNSGTNFAPFFVPDNSGVIFSSNVHSPKSGNFHLYFVNLKGVVTQITTEGTFNAFPMFSPDGTKLAWCSDRDMKNPLDINVMTADWIGPGRIY